MRRRIIIYRDDVWAGEGWLDEDGEIVNCSAVLGPTQDDSDDCYEAICDAIDDGSIERPDGTYSWAIEPARAAGEG